MSSEMMGERAEISARPILLAVVVLHNVPQLGLRLSQFIFIANSVSDWLRGSGVGRRPLSGHAALVHPVLVRFLSLVLECIATALA